MGARHRIPSIFNLSMVDVLCCALGCVILLWLLNFREAKRKADVAGETNSLLLAARAELDAAQRKLGASVDEKDAALARARAASSERDVAFARLAGLDKDLAAAKLRSGDLDKQLAALKLAQLSAEDRLQKKNLDYQALLRDREAALKNLDAQLKLTREQELLTKAAGKAADELAAKLRAADRQTLTLADQVPKLQDDLKTTQLRLLAAQEALGNQKAMTEQAVQARIVAENRFAGITLTGKRVVFLVDMSGSMDYADEKTATPDKWPSVREALVKIMRSLPNLEKFQVILFSDKTNFVLGGEDRWLSYDAKVSPEQASKALAAVKPKGNTNIYAAFEAAFRLRGDGLDTIYLLSDGLPNVGVGMTPEQSKALNDFQRAALLSKHVLKTLRTTWNQPRDGGRVRINSVGFFYESPDLGAFLWSLSRENDGSFVGMSKP